MRSLFFVFFLCIVNVTFAIENDTAVIEEASEVGQQNAEPDAAGMSKSTSHAEAPEQQTISLETAYKREYAFLEAQKRELGKQLNQFKDTAAQEQRSLSGKISTLERDSVERSAMIDSLNSKLLEVERQESAIDERSEVLETTYAQGFLTLENHDVNVPPQLTEIQGRDQAKVNYLFKQALTLLNKQSTVRSIPGEFFLENGKQTKGTIIHLGNIAAYGISDTGSGSLVPAGEGHFKIWKEPTADIATALNNNQQPDKLKLFLFESRTNAIEEEQDKTVIEVIQSGGIIGWIIVFLGGCAALLALIRAFLLYSNSKNTTQLSNSVIQQVANRELDRAKNSCNSGSSAIARVLSTTLFHLKDDRDHMDSIVHESILQESGTLDRFGSAILVIASVSPLLGLLGTVTGMISTFDVITEFGTGDPKLLSGGISIALVTTKLGLMVAIPTLLIGSLLAAWARNIKRDMEHAALSVTNVFFDGIDQNHFENSTHDHSLVLNP